MSASVCGKFFSWIQRRKLSVRSGKRLLKNLVSDGKTAVENFRQMLKKLRDDFLSEVIVSIETNVFRVVAEVESIGENVKALGRDIKEVGERQILVSILHVGLTLEQTST